jgi:hypothetical protein
MNSSNLQNARIANTLALLAGSKLCFDDDKTALLDYGHFSVPPCSKVHVWLALAQAQHFGMTIGVDPSHSVQALVAVGDGGENRKKL